MTHNFDEIIERRGTDSAKWGFHDPDVLPMWVADMDFRSPEPIIQALHERVAHGTFGYAFESKELREIICERMQRLYKWEVKPDEIVFSPGLVTGLNIATRAVGKPGDGVLTTTPVYGPFLTAPPSNARFTNMVELNAVKEGRFLHYEIDFDAFEAAITAQTSMFILCNPHNPVGRVYTRDELERMAAICLKHNMVICSDEIHCDLLLDDSQHLPIASLAPEISARTITLMAPSKTFNVPGLGCGFAIIQDETLRQQFQAAWAGAGHVNALGFTAAVAAYRDSQDWLDALLVYLQGNRDFLVDYLEKYLPEIRMARVEGTYLAWLDCREAEMTDKPADFCLKEARVACNDGDWFGRGGSGFIRLNFGCPRALLAEGLDRLRATLKKEPVGIN